MLMNDNIMQLFIIENIWIFVFNITLIKYVPSTAKLHSILVVSN